MGDQGRLVALGAGISKDFRGEIRRVRSVRSPGDGGGARREEERL